jgi:hypothetical protein
MRTAGIGSGTNANAAAGTNPVVVVEPPAQERKLA